MPKVIGVKFKKSSRIYDFEAGEHSYTEGCGVIVETSRGTEYGIVMTLPREVADSAVVQPLKPIVRLSTEADDAHYAELEARRDETMRICNEKIEKSGLEMKLVDAEYTFDNAKLIVYFTANGRVDFRDLVRDLASAFKMRIELRQIGERDECKMLGGLGSCGRECCCRAHLPDYAHVSIKMAKTQGLSLNPTKISGLCGRLMCCLSYENAFYAEVNKRLPKMGSQVFTADKRKGTVVALNQLKETVRLRIEENDKAEYADFSADEIVRPNNPHENQKRRAAESDDAVEAEAE